MARAVTMAFAKVNSVTTAKWRELTDDDGNTEQLIWRYKKVPDWYYNKLRDHRDHATARQTLKVSRCTYSSPISRFIFTCFRTVS